jgi:chromosome segregation ATPase
MDCSRTIGIPLERDPRVRRAVMMALQIGRRNGLRAAKDAIDEAQRQIARARSEIDAELAETRREIEALRQALAYAQSRYEMARDIIERANVIDAMRERDPMETLH